MKTPDNYTEEERAAIEAFKKMDTLQRMTLVLLSVLDNVGTVNNAEHRRDIITTGMDMYRAEVIRNFSQFALNEGNCENMLIGAVHESSRRHRSATDRFICLVQQHMHYWGETLQ